MKSSRPKGRYCRVSGSLAANQEIRKQHAQLFVHKQTSSKKHNVAKGISWLTAIRTKHSAVQRRR